MFIDVIDARTRILAYSCISFFRLISLANVTINKNDKYFNGYKLFHTAYQHKTETGGQEEILSGIKHQNFQIRLKLLYQYYW